MTIKSSSHSLTVTVSPREHCRRNLRITVLYSLATSNACKVVLLVNRNRNERKQRLVEKQIA